MLTCQAYCSYLRQYIRLWASMKIILLAMTVLLAILCLQDFDRNNRWCNPEKPLWWLCSWPNVEAVCSWNEHFPTSMKRIR